MKSTLFNPAQIRSLAMLLACTGAVGAYAQSSSDACSSNVANQYTVNSTCTFQTFNKPTAYVNNTNPGSCNSSANDDAFGWFTATATTTAITFDPTNNHDAILHVFSGTCASLSLIGCSDIGGNGVNETVTVPTTVGTNYIFRVQRAATNSSMDGSICVFNPVSNDVPCTATMLTVNTSCTGTAGTNVNSTGYVPTTVPSPTCASYSGEDVWFSFVAPASGSVELQTTAGSMNDSGMELYAAASCTGAMTSIECDDDDGPGAMSYISRTGLTPGLTYYVRIWEYGGGTGTFSICAWYTPPPANDEPCAATALALGNSCAATTYTNAGGTNTASIPDPGCGGYSGSARDVWFSFTAPATRTVHFEMTLGSLSNAAMALYAATACNGTFSLVECDDNDGIGNAPFLYFYDLVPGDTYYLRVWGNGGNQGTFDLCAVTPPTTADCFYALHLNDTGGDGWGGSTVGVSINGGGPTNYTLANGNRGMVYIPMNNGDIITLTYTAVGGFQSEISYILQNGYGILFSAGPTPAAGTVYANANDCVAPDPPREDCYGSLAICAASGNSSNPASTGLRPDLNLHTRGCLSNDERQGTWFNFTVSASGTIEFTIVPSNTGDDYDFALWGPESSISCPPTTSPYRCSYSDDAGNTGLLVSSSDVSEGASGDKFVQAIDVSVGEVYVLYVSNWSQSGLQFDLDFNMISGASIDCTVLPVELLTFEADALDRTVKLDWATASESGSSHFIVQRSSNGEDFIDIGMVDGAGTSFTTIQYGFVDQQPIAGTNYYRLKQVDADGSFSYSDIATVNFGSAVVAGTPYPNPTDGTVNVQLNANDDGPAHLEISDASGRTVHRSAHAITSGANTLRSDLRGLKPGTYMLTVIAPDGLPIRCGRFVLR